jgi:hypothetical protein
LIADATKFGALMAREPRENATDSKSLVENAFSVQFSSDLILPLPDSLQTDQNVADTDMHQHIGDSCRPSEHTNEKLTALRLACPAAGTTHICL